MTTRNWKWAAVCAAVAWGAATAAAEAPVTAEALAGVAARFQRDVDVLAADEMEGRGLGTKGLARSADWIEARLKSLGLNPASTGSRTSAPTDGSSCGPRTGRSRRDGRRTSSSPVGSTDAQ